MNRIPQKAVILAGGKGTRLGEISKTIPKPLQKIGGMAVLHHQIKLLSDFGIQEIFVITHYLSETIEDSIKNINAGNNKSNIVLFKEPKELGTVGGIKELESRLNGDFFVIYGDIMLDMDLERMALFHVERNSDITLAVHPTSHPHDSDLMELGVDNRIAKFHSKYQRDLNKDYPNISNAGIYLFSPKIFPLLVKGRKADFGKDIFPRILHNLNLYGYNTPEYLKDIGTPDRISKVRRDYAKGIINKKCLKFKQKAIFIDRDGVINKQNGYISKTDDLAVYKNAITAIKQVNHTEYLAIVVTNQPVVSRGDCTIDDLNKIHWKLEKTLGCYGAKLDAIFYCPHHPDVGFKGENLHYKINCDCRKPKTGMIDAAVTRFNIDVKQSYIVGDTWRDMKCGENAGLKTVLVERYRKNPTIRCKHRAKNLLEAVRYILN